MILLQLKTISGHESHRIVWDSPFIPSFCQMCLLHLWAWIGMFLPLSVKPNSSNPHTYVAMRFSREHDEHDHPTKLGETKKQNDLDISTFMWLKTLKILSGMRFSSKNSLDGWMNILLILSGNHFIMKRSRLALIIFQSWKKPPIHSMILSATELAGLSMPNSLCKDSWHPLGNN